MNNEFVKSSPEEQGIPTKAIIDTLNFLKMRDVAMHSFLLMRNDFIVCEAYYAPYNKNTLHRMFSQTKSLTSLAIGILCNEGRLSLYDYIVDYFPDKLPPQGPSPELAKLTIKDMLRMATPYTKTTYKDYLMDDWIKTFFIANPSHTPGTVFCYDTSSSHVLGALVEKLSGMPLLEYLREKCLNEIGFSQSAYCLKEPSNVSWGGAGLMATPSDMLKVLMLLKNNGVHNGKAIIPRWYIDEATSKQIDTEANSSGCEFDQQQGYGYQFWQTSHNGWAMFGMGGQLSICLPEKNLLIVTTADTQGKQGGVQLIFDAIWEKLIPQLQDEKIEPKQQDENNLQNFVDSLGLNTVRGSNTSPIASKVTGKKYAFNANNLGITSLKFNAQNNNGSIDITYGTDTMNLVFGFGENVYGIFEGNIESPNLKIWQNHAATHLFKNEKPNTYVGSAAWKDEETLLIKLQLLAARLGNIVIQLCFKQNSITVLMRCFEEMGYAGFDGIVCGYLEN